MDTSAADSTRRLALALTPPSFAVIITTPADSPVMTPGWLTTAIFVSEELQVTRGLRFSVEPSVKFPAAVYSFEEAGAISACRGVTDNEARLAELTVSGIVPVFVFPAKVNVALIFAVPALTPVAKPEFGALPTVAITVLSELQL